MLIINLNIYNRLAFKTFYYNSHKYPFTDQINKQPMRSPTNII